MNCEEVRERLEEYMQGEVEGDESQEITDHLEACAGCRDEYTAMANTVDNIQSVYEGIEIPDRLAEVTVSGKRRIFGFGWRNSGNTPTGRGKTLPYKNVIAAAACLLAILCLIYLLRYLPR